MWGRVRAIAMAGSACCHHANGSCRP
jgi:hypothetical protein